VRLRARASTIFSLIRVTNLSVFGYSPRIESFALIAWVTWRESPAVVSGWRCHCIDTRKSSPWTTVSDVFSEMLS